MSEFVYLIKLKDLYKIGVCTDLEKSLKQIGPDSVLETLSTQDPNGFQARILRRYKKNRIPDSNYFRFDELTLQSCRKYFRDLKMSPDNIKDEVNIMLTASLILLLLGLFISQYLPLGFFSKVSISLFVSSLPMWSVVILGNFGGYDMKDVGLFSTLSTRLKSLFFAISFLSFAYLSFLFNTYLSK